MIDTVIASPSGDALPWRAADVASAPSRPVALSIRQPWAWAILYAGKRVENRTWQTAYRGPLFIHAGLRVDHGAVDDLSEVISRIPEPRPTAYCGALIATATLIDCVSVDEVPIDQISWAGGPWCFILDDVRPLARPIPHRGALGLFPVHPRAELRAIEGLQSQIYRRPYPETY